MLRRDLFTRATSEIIKRTLHVDPTTGEIGIPLSKGMTFRTTTDADANRLTTTFDGGKGYAVYRNETRTMLANIMDYIEGGQKSLIVSAGRVAYDLPLKLLSPRSHIIVAPPDVYTGLRGLFDFYKEREGLEVSFVESTPEALAAAYRPGETKMVFAETITNPRLKVADLQVIADFAKRHGLISVVDNTAAPLLVRPLDYGFDISVHSLTKYANGFNDDAGGAIVFNKNRSDLAKKLENWCDKTGPIMAPDVAYGLIKSMCDFPERLRTHCEHALYVADALSRDPRIAAVHYPGLENDPGHELALNQGYQGFGGLVSFELEGNRNHAARFLEQFNNSPGVFVADSFASEWFLGYPCSQSVFFRDMDPVKRAEHGITETFFRLAVGRTDPDEFLGEFRRALNVVYGVAPQLTVAGIDEHTPR